MITFAGPLVYFVLFIIIFSWLKVTHQVVNEDEYEMTKDAVEEFRRNEGPKLQKYLEAK